MFKRKQTSEEQKPPADYAAVLPPANSKYPAINYNVGPPPLSGYGSLPPSKPTTPLSVGGLGSVPPAEPQTPAVPQPPSSHLPSFPPVAPPPAIPLTHSPPVGHHGLQQTAPPNAYSPPAYGGGQLTDAASESSPSGMYDLVASSPPPAYGQVPTQGQHSRIPVHAKPRMSQAKQQQMWTPPPPTVLPNQGLRSNKKALIIGINYRGTVEELKGCIHDARNVEFMLQSLFGFQKESMRLLLDDGSGRAYPTRLNILRNIGWLVEGAQPGDSLFFHFSGHGSQKPDYTGDERDGLNETLLPCDFRQSGHIIDDEINELLINPLPRGVHLHAIIDACHSGTAMDLEFYTKIKGPNIEWRSEGPTRKYKGTSGGIAVLFSACADSQVAQDTDTLSGNVHTGAATHSFIEAIVENGPSISYAQVLSHMVTTMDKLSGKPATTPGLGGKILDKLTNTVMFVLGIPHQTPQLSCNTQLNLNEKLHI